MMINDENSIKSDWVSIREMFVDHGPMVGFNFSDEKINKNCIYFIMTGLKKSIACINDMHKSTLSDPPKSSSCGWC